MKYTVSAQELLDHLRSLEYVPDEAAPALMAAAIETFGPLGFEGRKRWKDLVQAVQAVRDFHPDLDPDSAEFDELSPEDREAGAALETLRKYSCLDQSATTWSSPGLLWIGSEVQRKAGIATLEQRKVDKRRGKRVRPVGTLWESRRTLFILKAVEILNSATPRVPKFVPEPRPQQPRCYYGEEIASALLVQLGAANDPPQRVKTLYHQAKRWLREVGPSELAQLTCETYRPRAEALLRQNARFGFPSCVPSWVQIGRGEDVPSRVAADDARTASNGDRGDRREAAQRSKSR